MILMLWISSCCISARLKGIWFCAIRVLSSALFSDPNRPLHYRKNHPTTPKISQQTINNQKKCKNKAAPNFSNNKSHPSPSTPFNAKHSSKTSIKTFHKVQPKSDLKKANYQNSTEFDLQAPSLSTIQLTYWWTPTPKKRKANGKKARNWRVRKARNWRRKKVRECLSGLIFQWLENRISNSSFMS